MERISKEEIREILNKAENRLASRVNLEDTQEQFPGENFSREYKIFRRETLENDVARYEQLCNLSEKIVKVRPKEKERDKLQRAIEVTHLDITVEGASSFAVLITFFLLILGMLLAGLGYYFSGENGFIGIGGGIKSISFNIYFWPLVIVLLAGIILKPLSKYPIRLANKWRLKASNQMVLCILYTVMYMRHTSNLENAIKFTGEHIGNPLALDLRKVLWDVETTKELTIKESLDNYLEGWRDHSLEFVESFHLIEGSLYEPDELKRISLLEKALEVILSGTYEKMLHYAHDLRSPMTFVYMLGVILPVLGLVLFPLLSGFLSGLVKWWHLAIIYNILLPLGVYLFGISLLEKRPTGYGDEDVLRAHPEFEDFTKMDILGTKTSPFFFALFLGGVLFLIGLSPLIMYYLFPGVDPVFFGYKLLDFKCDINGCVGPYGMWSMLLSLFVPLSLAVGLAFYYWVWSKNLIKIKNNTNKLEKEFSGAIFQLGNRVGDGLPVEVAFGRVSNSMKGTSSGDFLRIVNSNITKLGMSVKEAIFNKDRGGINYFPSNLIKSSMKVLVESAKKGPAVVSKSLITISDYINRVNSITERLKDLLADILSSMKSQTTFLTPMIAGIVVGVSSMMINVINLLSLAIGEVETGGSSISSIDAGALPGIFGPGGTLNITDIIPGYQFQIVVGLFVLEVVVILTILSNGIENGLDKVTEKNRLAKNLVIAVGLYCMIALVSILIFSVLASGIGDALSQGIT